MQVRKPSTARRSHRRKPEQLELRPRTWGGKRKGAGRPKGARSGVPHRSRPSFARPLPLHVTLRMAAHVYNLRSRRSFRVLEQALVTGGCRFGLRVVRFSIQGNHIHLLVEADDKSALMRGIKGLSVRIAKGMNRLMRREGRVLSDRYHARALRTPTEVRHVVTYLRENHRNHMAAAGRHLPAGWIDPYSSDSPELDVVLPRAQTWLCRVGWQRGAP